eukprot:PhF_6_TR14949/c0_g1_i2/m.23448/K12183/TSG101, STP22, VPS23; ESCRT-I complex subunit TSG101
MESFLPRITQIYGADMAKGLYEDVTSLRPYEGSAFFPFAPSVRSLPSLGGECLVLEGSVLVERSTDNIAVVPLRIVFARNNASYQRLVYVSPTPSGLFIRPDHPFVSPIDGKVTRVPGGGSAALLDTILSLASAFHGKDFPFSMGSNTTQSPQRSGATPTSPPAPLPTPPPPPPMQPPIVKDPLRIAVEEKLRSRAQFLQNEANTQIGMYQSKAQLLKDSSNVLGALRDSLIKKKDALLQANISVSQWAEHTKAATNGNTVETVLTNVSNWFTPENETSAQVLELSSADSALEDTLDALEQLLKKKTITAEVYVREVHDVARQQFVVRALLNKLRLSAEQQGGAGGKRPVSPPPQSFATPQQQFQHMITVLQ